MIGSYPASPSIEDNYHNLPIHAAAQNGASLGVVKVLLEAHPSSVKHRNSGNKLPKDLAVSEEVKDLLSSAYDLLMERERVEAAETAAKQQQQPPPQQQAVLEGSGGGILGGRRRVLG